jgi:hypothetical protein
MNMCERYLVIAKRSGRRNTGGDFVADYISMKMWPSYRDIPRSQLLNVQLGLVNVLPINNRMAILHQDKQDIAVPGELMRTAVGGRGTK